jgi:predicted MFS family arabinose efflux permease
LANTPSSSNPSANSSEPAGFSGRLVAAVAAAWAVSLLGYYAQVQLLGPIMREFERGEAAVGWLFSLENTVLAISALAVAGPLARWSRTRVALIGGVIVVLANVVSAFAWSFESLVVMRALAGVGTGLVGAAGTASAASTREPDRLFAAATLAWGFGGAAEPSIVPLATVGYGSSGGYLLIAGMCLLLLPLLRWLIPPRRAEEAQPSFRTAPHRSLALVAMLALLIYEIGQGGIWTFIEQIGLRSQLNEYEVGLSLTATDLVGLAGAAIATMIGTRFGRRGPILIGLAMGMVAAVTLATSEDSVVFVAMLWLWNFSYYFVVPYLLGAMAELDDLGRWVVATDAVWTLGDGLGPGIAGSLVELGGYGNLAGLGLATGLTCVVLMLGVLRRLEVLGDEPPGGGSAAIST